MKNNLRSISLIGLFASAMLMGSCVATVRAPAPPARVEVRPVAPSPRHVWVPGHYMQRGRNYIWVNGFYTTNQRRGGRYR